MRLPALLLAAVLAAVSLLRAADAPALPPAREAMLRETVEKCRQTAADKPTGKLIREKVTAACALIEKDGPAAFAHLAGKDSAFVFSGTYIFVHDPRERTIVFLPTQPLMEGKNMAHLKDDKGRFFFIELQQLALEKGGGWLEYGWPKPGEKTFSPKTTYVRLAKYQGKEYTVGCGVYDCPLAEIVKEFGGTLPAETAP